MEWMAMTYDVKMDTNNGHIEIEGKFNESLVDNQSTKAYNELANKFFSLEQTNS